MRRLRNLGLRGRLLLLVSLAILPALGLLGAQAFDRRRQQTDELNQSVLNLARLVAHAKERRLEGARQLLVAMSRSSDIRSDRATCTRYVRDLVAEYGGMYRQIGWADTSGRVMCHALESPEGVSIADRAFFKQALATGEFTVGEALMGRISGAPALAFAQALRSANGEFEGVMFASIDLGVFGRVLREEWRTEGTTVSVLDRNGAIVARAPEANRPVVTRASAAQLKVMRQQRELVREFAGADGVMRVYGIVAVREASDRDPVMFVSVGVRRDVLLADTDRRLRLDLLIFACLGLGILGAAGGAVEWLIRRPVTRLVDATTQLASGRLETRVGDIAGVPELATLGRAFDDMAARLQQRDLHLREGQRLEAVGQLAGGIAHDFNNLLTVIVGYGETLRAHIPEGSDAAADLSALRTAAERAAALTHQLLAFSRRQFLQPRPLDLNGTLSGMQSLLERTMGGEIRVVTELDPAVGVVLADPAQVEQVILNLAINARDAMPGGGEVRFETINIDVEREQSSSVPVPCGQYVVLRVSDTGLGMSDAVRERIFEPFFTTKGNAGTGLGLATVYGIVKQSGGYVFCDSAPGQGTRFTIFLPRTSEALPETPREVRNTPPGGTESIILVDDEDSVRRLMAHVLERNGYDVRSTGLAQEALEWIRAGAPADLLVTDMRMPGMSGPQLAEHVAALRPELRVLLISGYASDAADGAATRTRHSFLQKPFTPHDLLLRVRELLPQSCGAGL
jgi:signal transduction histidine kinase/CheY-like chemotaxis protein